MSPLHLALDPISRGFAYVVFDADTEELFDAARVYLKDTTPAAYVRAVRRLLKRVKPVRLVLEDVTGDFRRCPRVRSILRRLKRLATTSRIEIVLVSRTDVRKAFAETARTKHGIAVALADRYPELRPQLPPVRMPWMAEDERMSLFDALSFVLAARSTTKR